MQNESRTVGPGLRLLWILFTTAAKWFHLLCSWVSLMQVSAGLDPAIGYVKLLSVDQEGMQWFFQHLVWFENTLHEFVSWCKVTHSLTLIFIILILNGLGWAAEENRCCTSIMSHLLYCSSSSTWSVVLACGSASSITHEVAWGYTL